jgi:GT2 family glycosyltransferase
MSAPTHDDEKHLAVSGDEPAPEAVVQELRASLEEKNRQIALQERELQSLRTALAARDATLDLVTNSRGWRLLNTYRALRNRFLSHPLVGFVTRGRRLVLSTAEYHQWINLREEPARDFDRMRADMAAFTYKPLISIVMPVFNTPLEFLEKAIRSVQGQLYDKWELCVCDDGSTAPHVRSCLEAWMQQDQRIKVTFASKNGGISAASNAALTLATGEYVGLLDHDDELTPDALYEVVRLLQEHPQADVVYSDEDKLELDGARSDPFFKPDWSPEYLLACMYTCHFGVYRKALVDVIGGFRLGFEGSQDYDLMLRMTERTQKIFHIPRILYHWRKVSGSTAAFALAKSSSSDAGRRALEEHMQRRGIEAVVVNDAPNRYRVRPRLLGNPKVSIIIPTKDKVPLLRRCLESIERKTDYGNYEVIVVDNGSVESATKAFLATVQHRVIQAPGPFNFSRINNAAVQQASGEYLLFLNNDTEVISPEWLVAMLEFCQLPEIGIVGAKLLFPNDTVQHAGVVLGLGGVAGHCFLGAKSRDRGYFDLLFRTRNVSAVTAACMMIRRTVFDEVGRFDEELPVAFGDVDLCLQVRNAGYRIVYTPYAMLYHYESASRGYGVASRDIAAMKQRWGDMQNDPFYNPNLSLKRSGYKLDI